MPRAIHTLVAEAEREFGPLGAAQLAEKIHAKAHRLRVSRECPTPLDLAERFDFGLVRNPMLDLLNERIYQTMCTRDGRLVVSCPPQSGKSNLMQWAIARRLLDNPAGRIGYASYGKDLARRAGRIVRGRIEAHLAPGLRIAPDHRDASDWEFATHQGGMYSVGVGGGFTGRPIDEGLVVDDPIKDLQDAESPAVIGHLFDWWSTVAQTRLWAGAWVIFIQTRWTETELVSSLIDEGWPHVNIPAQAEVDIPDALGRPVGEFLESVQGLTPLGWQKKREGVGERTWYALYQGVPSPPKGDIFNEDWFDRDRVTERPVAGSPPVVVIDPADNTGSGDEAGIIVASTDRGQRIYLGPDYSDHYTVGRWIRVALLAVARHEASGLVFEQSLSGLSRAISTGWAQLRKQALVLRRLGATGPLDPDLIEVAVTELAHRDDPDTTWEQYRQELIELWPLVEGVLRFTPSGPMIRRVKPQGSKEWRAKAASPSYEQRRVSHVGKLAQLEHQMLVWSPGMKSPDRMDACLKRGTLVLTARGEVPVEDVRIGDQAWTRIGWRDVTDSGLTRRAACVWDVELSNGTVLTGTPDHRVWTTHGWSRIDALIHGDTLSGWTNPPSPSSTEASPTDETQTGNSARTASTTQPPEDPKRHTCTARYGETPTQTGLSRPCGTSTMTTTTRSIMIPATLSSSPPESTRRNTPQRCGSGVAPTSTSSDPSPSHGTPAKLVRRGTVSTPSSHGKAGNPNTSEPARSAADNSCPTNPTRRGAPERATRRHTALETPAPNERLAQFVGRSSTALGSAVPPGPVPVAVVRVSEADDPADVFDLTVDEAHEFVAAGVIVHNCVHAILLLSGASVATLATPTGPELPTRSTRSPQNRGAALPRSTLTRRR